MNESVDRSDAAPASLSEPTSPGSLSGAAMPATPSLLREINEQTVLNAIRRLRSVSRAEVARQTGLSKPTVSLALRTLEASGLVRPVGTETGRRGRAGVLYEAVSDAAIGAAAEVTVSGVRAVAVDLDGTVLHDTMSDWPAQPGTAEEVVGGVTRTLEELRRLTGGRLDALVVGTPGVEDPRTGILHRVGTIPALEGAELSAMIADAVGVEPSIYNDVDLVALGERAEGHGRDVGDFVVLWIGSGLGSALVIDGHLVVGHAGGAGEIFDVPFARAIEGSAGVDEEFTQLGLTTDGTLALARRLAGAGCTWDGAVDVLDAAVLGDRIAVDVLTQVARWTAWYVGTLVALVDPALVVLAGPLGSHDAIRAAVESQLIEWTGSAPTLVSSKLGARSVLAGAAAVASERAAQAAFDRRILDRDEPAGTPGASGTQETP